MVDALRVGQNPRKDMGIKQDMHNENNNQIASGSLGKILKPSHKANSSSLMGSK